MIRAKLLAGVLFAIPALTAAVYSETSQPVALRGGQLFGSKTGQLLAKQVVLIEGHFRASEGQICYEQRKSGAQQSEMTTDSGCPNHRIVSTEQ